MRVYRVLIASLLLMPVVGLITFGAHANPVGATAPVSYREAIEPLFKANCATCHSSAAHTAGFDVESPEALLRGGSKFGAKVVVAGKANSSMLVAYLRGRNQPRMPMGRPALDEAQIQQVEAWINQGAKIDAIKLGWPYTRPVNPTVPPVKNAAWVRNPVDRFILAKLEAHHLKPAPPASKIALMRRVYADLIGMPPSPQEAAAFLNDAAPNAYEKLVDRLLADSRYGERWARHWLDLVRYADTHGFENDGARPRAWRYRDYVIRAFNADKPYDRFLKEQLAGDELYPNDSDALVATGYARLCPWDELSTDPPQRWQDSLNDVTDTTGSVMLGLTVGCARCHNHKYDRITQADYYRMQAFFTPIRWTETGLPSTPDPEAFKKRVAEADAKLQALRQQEQTLREKHRALVLAEKKQKAQPGTKIEASDDEINASIEKNQADHETRDRLQDEIGQWDRDSAPYRPVAEAITDQGKDAPPTHLLLRGNLLTPGPEVKPGFVASLAGGQEKPAVLVLPTNGKTTGRRSALANWIASSDNPMTARVLVNRLWQHHFGRGIVGTPSDFGRNGDKATHRELLDWLAVRFMQDGWSLKKMHRLMLTSNAYRMSTDTNPTAEKTDPTNALFWRMNRIRLEGEALRDSILTVSGRLNPEMYGPGVYPKLSEEVLSTGSTHKWGDSPEAEGLRRTIYVFQRRSLFLPIVEAFDGADMSNTCPRRSVTTIAPQALALFNGDFSRTEARYFATRVVQEAGNDPGKQIDRAYQIALVRLPTAGQKALAMAFLAKQTQLHLHPAAPASGLKTAAFHGKTDDAQAHTNASLAALADFCHVLINTNEFLYLD